MPIHPDWRELYHSFIEQYGEEKGKSVFYAYCEKHSIDYTKPKPKKESFSWTGSIKEMPGVDNLIRGKALHPLRTVHPEEWPQVREYLEEELEKSAHTLAGKPLLLDHYHVLRGKVLDAEYEDGAIEYVAQLNDPRVMELIRNGAIKHCSVEFKWKSLEQVNGVAPRGINFTGLSLLRLFQPGDPKTTVEVWEGIITELKEAKNIHRGGYLGTSTAKEQAEPQEFILYAIRGPAAFLEERFSTAWIDLENGIQAIYGRLREDPENPQPMALLFMKAKGWTLEKMQGWLQDHSQYLRQSQPAAATPAGIQSVSPTPPTAQEGVTKMSGEKPKLKTLEARVAYLETSNWLKEQELSQEEIEAKINELTEQRQNLENELQQIAEEEQPIRDKVWQQIDLINAELQAYEQALAALVAGLTQPAGPAGSTEEGKAKEAEWDTEYVNDLPDSAFAFIEPGGEKDEQGKTTPRSLRHFEYKNMQGNLDRKHIVNGLARLGQELGDWATAEAKAQIRKKLCSAVNAWNREHEDKIESDVCGTAEEAIKEQGNQEPEKDEHGCIIGKERYDERQDKCVRTTAEARIAFLETSLKLKEQQDELTVEEIKQKIIDLTKQKEELDNKLYPESKPETPLSEEERAAIQAQIDVLYAEIEAYEQALAAKIAGQVAESKKKSLGEAIIAPGTSEPQPSDPINKQEILALIPDKRVWRSWSYGPQILVKQLKHKLEGE